MEYQTHNEEETKKVAADFASTLKGGSVVFLKGDLGMGKTTFVRGVAEYFGFLDPVRSPTFTIVNRYPIQHKHIKQILHVDFYRIDDPSEIPKLALEDEMGKTDTVTFIEWPEKAGRHTILSTHHIDFSEKENTHIITLKHH